jgi:hypothetical protein
MPPSSSSRRCTPAGTSRIAAQAGGDTDTSRAYEYTDWNAVARFARQFAQRAKA